MNELVNAGYAEDLLKNLPTAERTRETWCLVMALLDDVRRDERGQHLQQEVAVLPEVLGDALLRHARLMEGEDAKAGERLWKALHDLPDDTRAAYLTEVARDVASEGLHELNCPEK